jgi:hypothetical protein
MDPPGGRWFGRSTPSLPRPAFHHGCWTCAARWPFLSAARYPLFPLRFRYVAVNVVFVAGVLMVWFAGFPSDHVRNS